MRRIIRHGDQNRPGKVPHIDTDSSVNRTPRRSRSIKAANSLERIVLRHARAVALPPRTFPCQKADPRPERSNWTANAAKSRSSIPPFIVTFVDAGPLDVMTEKHFHRSQAMEAESGHGRH